MKTAFVILVFILFLMEQGGAQNPEKIDAYLKELYKNSVIPGFSIIVVKNGKVFFEKGYGKERIGSPKPFTAKSICSIGSLTKSMTALAVMQLVGQGKIGLDKPVVQYIPWFRAANKERSDKITVRMLLDNTSGLYVDNVSFTSNSAMDPLEQRVRSLAHIYLTREPGISYTYSNVGFSVAGLIVSKVAGMSYGQFVQQNIFDRIHMVNSSVNTSAKKTLDYLPGHYYGIYNAIPAGNENNPRRLSLLPAGSLTYSNAEDIGKYLLALMNGSNNELLSVKSRDQLWTKYTSFPGLSHKEGGDNSTFGYGMG